MSEPLRLHPADIEALADAIAARLAQPTATPQHVDAAEIARRFALSASWVREHADELGALRVGDGPRPRLRFDPEHVASVLACDPTRRSPAADAPAPEPVSRRPRRRAETTGARLLPIRGRTP